MCVVDMCNALEIYFTIYNGERHSNKDKKFEFGDGEARQHCIQDYG